MNLFDGSAVSKAGRKATDGGRKERRLGTGTGPNLVVWSANQRRQRVPDVLLSFAHSLLNRPLCFSRYSNCFIHCGSFQDFLRFLPLISRSSPDHCAACAASRLMSIDLVLKQMDRRLVHTTSLHVNSLTQSRTPGNLSTSHWSASTPVPRSHPFMHERLMLQSFESVQGQRMSVSTHNFFLVSFSE